MNRALLAVVAVPLVGLVAPSVGLLAGCNASAPPRGPEDTCVRACDTRATNCSHEQCLRGCNLVLDRLVEREGDHVLACVASAKTACNDRAWARCATRIGVHADGGPPAPPPPSEDDSTDDGD